MRKYTDAKKKLTQALFTIDKLDQEERQAITELAESMARAILAEVQEKITTLNITTNENL